MSAQHTPGPWFVTTYTNCDGIVRETLQHSTRPLSDPAFCFNTEIGCGQDEADTRNRACATFVQVAA